MVRKVFCVVGAVLLFIGFVLYGPVVFAQEKVIQLKFSNVYGVTHRNGQLAEQWCKEVEKRTNGRVKINYYAGGTADPGPQIYDSMVKGIADIGSSVLSYTRGKFPMTEMLDLPLGVQDRLSGDKTDQRVLQEVPAQGVR